MSHCQSIDKTRVFNPKQNKEKCSCHKSKGGRPSMSYHKKKKNQTKQKTKTKNRKKKQNLDAKGKIFNIVHLLTI